MDEAGLKESRVICENSQGLQIEGPIVQLGQHEVIFEVYSPAEAAVIQSSEVLREFKVHFRNYIAYSGRAIVKSVVQIGAKAVCAAALDDGWQMQFSNTDLQPGRMPALFKEHLRQWQKLYRIRPEYKLQIADMESFFAELRQWVDQVELGLRTTSPKNSEQLENEVAEELGVAVLPSVDALFDKFEHIANAVDPAARPVHRTYMQRRLHPLILCAPFVHRTFTKPLGYAGDYEMVNMIARNRPEGPSLYAKIVNLCFVRQPPAFAHRNRLNLLTQRLVEETARIASQRETARIFCLACGPAMEVQNFLREHDLSNRAEFTLLDFNEETLEHVTAVFTDLKAKYLRRTPVQFVKRSVHQLLRESARASARPGTGQQYDFVYCAGLFDYLTDAVCQRLLTLLYDWVAPGGLLLATNVEPSNNPVRTGTEHLLDWHLICRKGPQLQALRPSQVAKEDFVIRSDMTGVNLFMEVRKPKDG
jgi:extracellular factor (EF) 3-hydroxypalmitic acid methyl ester biosynthesis protein